MKQGFLYEFNCIEDGEWIPEKKTFEDRLVEELRFIWNHRYHLERRYIQQYLLGKTAAIWRFERQQKETRKKLIRELRAYRSNREFAPDLHQSLETWYLQNYKRRMDIAPAVRYLLVSSWTENPDLFRNAKKWEHRLQSNEETQTQNRLKQLPLNVQKHVYEIAGMAGTNCPNWDSTAYNQATTAFLLATSEELQDFLFDHARYNLEHRISWYDVIQEAYRTSRQKRVYREYLRSPEWKRKSQAVLNRAMQPFIVEPIIIHRTRDRYGRLIESLKTEWKPICERVECSQVAEHVHHYNYERVGKELIGMDPEASEENDLIALCRECHAALHAEGKIVGTPESNRG